MKKLKLILHSIFANERLARRYSEQHIIATGAVWYLNDKGEWISVHDTELTPITWNSIKELNKMKKSDKITSKPVAEPLQETSLILKGFWKLAHIIAGIIRFVLFIREAKDEESTKS